MEFRWMNRLLLLCASLFAAAALTGCGGSGSSSSATAQHEWAWMGGSQKINAAGIYGTKDTASQQNMPGARSAAAFWTDSQGNLWLFGGVGIDANKSLGGLSDLWEYSGGQWTWVSGSNSAPGPAVPGGSAESSLFGNIGAPGVYGTMGVAAAANTPGAQNGAAHWTDAHGNLWLFSGYGVDGSDNWASLNDLWKFTPSSGQWTWMGGTSTAPTAPKGVYGTIGVASATNMPGPRSQAAGWTDAQGNLWLFGGYGADADGKVGYLSDVWKYTPSNGQWTWVADSEYANQPYNFTQQGTPSASATPGARSDMLSWTDSKGNLWLYGGESNSIAPQGQINFWADLWMFSPSSGQWTWVGGSSTPNQSVNFGQMGVAAASNTPGSRWDSATWTDAQGNLWLFGGTSVNGPLITAYSDLWEYSNGQWTWVLGKNQGFGSSYGTLGVAASSNYPPIRAQAAAWVDSSGHLLLFGGETAVSMSGGELDVLPNTSLNDLWEYTP